MTLISVASAHENLSWKPAIPIETRSPWTLTICLTTDVGMIVENITKMFCGTKFETQNDANQLEVEWASYMLYYYSVYESLIPF